MTSAFSATASLRSLVLGRRILICVGSGGVGKTTTAATLALISAVLGRRVLVLTIDPARRLADALGMQALGHDIQRVPEDKLDALALARGLERVAGGQLSAMMLDQKRAFDELVGRYAVDKNTQGRILKNGIYQQISSRLAGSHEYAAMSKLYELSQDRKDDFDLIVLDTPPTENALDFLDAGERLSQAIDSPALQWIIKPYLQQAGTWGARFVGVGGAFVLRGLSRFVGSQFLSQMAEFFVEFADVTAGFRERAQRIRTLFKKPEVAFVLVCSPEPLSIEEALYFQERLHKAEMPLGGVVVNRVNQGGPEVSEQIDALVRRSAALVGLLPEDVTQVIDALRRTYDEQQILTASDQASIRLVREAIKKDRGEQPLCQVPIFESDVHDVAGLSLVSQFLVP